MVPLGSVEVRVSVRYRLLFFRVRVTVCLFALYFIYLYSVDGVTGVATLGTRIGVPTLGY